VLTCLQVPTGMLGVISPETAVSVVTDAKPSCLTIIVSLLKRLYFRYIRQMAQTIIFMYKDDYIKTILTNFIL
jgi:hypothetical protein